MTFGPGRLVVLCGLVPTLVAAVLSLYRPAFLRNWEYGAYDTVLRATPTRPPDGRIVIVDIDDRSLTTIGQWPWRRDVVGQLVSRLRDLGAATVALDIIFAEPDRFEGTGRSPDEMLADTLREGRVVLGYAHDLRRSKRTVPLRVASSSTWPSCAATIPPKTPSSRRRARFATCSVLTAGGQRLGVPERRAGPRRPAPARPAPHRARWSGLSEPRADRRSRRSSARETCRCGSRT